MMLMPTLSVTLIGLVAGGIVAASSSRGWRTLVVAVVSAWIGFLAGALVGVAIDVAAHTGVWVVILGHGMALVVAVVACLREPDGPSAVPGIG